MSQPHERRSARKTAISTLNQLAGLLHTIDQHRESALKGFQKATAERLAGFQLQTISSIPLRDLKNYGATSVRWQALENAGIHTAFDVLNRIHTLNRINGVGQQTTERIVIAARKALDEASRTPALPLSADPSRWSPQDLGLVKALLQYADIDTALRSATLLGQGRALVEVSSLVKRVTGIFTPRRKWREFLDARATALDHLSSSQSMVPEIRNELLRIAALCETATRNQLTDQGARDSWRGRSAELGAVRDNLEHATRERAPDGLPIPLDETDHLFPEELLAKINSIKLDTTGLNVRLRRYQDFGARFVLAGEGVILGDEMGLGKTIEAIAVAHHMRRQNDQFLGLVVAPASIMENWRREIVNSSDIPVVVMHGLDRQDEVEQWKRERGFGITSYQTLAKLEQFGIPVIDLVIVDEAHRVKNPAAQQTQTVSRYLQNAGTRLLLTGTPLENRASEFIILSGMANPSVGGDLVSKFGDGRRAHLQDLEFRRAIAPAYLRRNQSEVLTELPEMTVTNDFVEIGFLEKSAYESALMSNNLAAARRAVTIGGGRDSAKVARLIELLDDFRESAEKVLVFSFFLDVLDMVGQCAGPSCRFISGSVTPAKRQEIIDEFQKVEGHAVLAMQIEAGGVGLNLQAASAVIIMEPQWKPSTEVQAVARAHRMGQTRPVQVHRLLAANTIDERIEELLGTKQALFDKVARPSDLASASEDAVSTSMQTSILMSERDKIASN